MILPIDEAVAPWAIGHLIRVMDHINPNWIQRRVVRSVVLSFIHSTLRALKLTEHDIKRLSDSCLSITNAVHCLGKHCNAHCMRCTVSSCSSRFLFRYSSWSNDCSSGSMLHIACLIFFAGAQADPSAVS